MPSRLSLAALLIILVLPPALPLGAQVAPAGTELRETIQELLGRLEERDLEDLWDSVARIENLGKEDAVPVLREELSRGGERARLACALALIDLRDRDSEEEAIAALAALVKSSRTIETRVAALRLLGEHGRAVEVTEFLEGLLEETTNPELAIPIAKTLWELDRPPVARTRLLELVGSRDPATRNAAALALAETRYFDGTVREILRKLRQEPTMRGRLAYVLLEADTEARRRERAEDAGISVLPGADPQVLLQKAKARIRELELEREDLLRGVVRKDEGADYVPVIKEVLDHIETSHVERPTAPEKVRLKRRDLIAGALDGMVGRLDPFSAFLDPAESERFNSDIEGAYFGIGAQVGKPAEGEPLEILKPMYGGPAYEADLVTGDQILEVDDVPTSGEPTDEVVERLKGKPDSIVKLKVLRRGWDESREIEIVRRVIEVPSVTFNLLPGKIGLIKVFQFGTRTFDELKGAIDGLRDGGAEAYILDLRNNPGGKLDVAVDVVDLFVGEEELPIYSVRGPSEESGDRTFPTAGMVPEPLVILINEHSASAAEIVSGALQDYHRATLVGKRSFGKGSVQSVFPLSGGAQAFLGGEAHLKLTVQYYYLPSGRCVHTVRTRTGEVLEPGGVTPDVEVDAQTYPAWLREEIERIRVSRKVSDYVAARFDEIKGLLLEGDLGDPSRYPEFDELYGSLMDDPGAPADEARRASRDHARQIVRFQLRRRYEDSIGKELAGDFQDDVQLQRAIVEALGKMGRDPAGDPVYGMFVEKGE